MEVIDHEGIVSSLEEIVNKFSDKIGPYAYSLVLHLSNIFLKYSENKFKNKSDEDDGAESELAASGCLNAIKRIINSNLE